MNFSVQLQASSVTHPGAGPCLESTKRTTEGTGFAQVLEQSRGAAKGAGLTGCTRFPGSTVLNGDDQMERMRQMQLDSQQQNLELIELQKSVQSENQRFSTVSNLMKARHDTAKSAISNIRV